MKRIFDLTFLFFLSPMLLLLIFFFSFTGYIFQGKPIFFTQYRGGYRNRKFRIYKFRSMKVKKKIYNQAVTPYGRFLRRFKIDELPQFYNVLKGDISIVGPRPLHYEYKNFYSKEQKKRFEIKPGLTGYSQIITKNQDSWKKRFDLDLWYINNRTFILDMKIILITFCKILKLFFKNDEKKLLTKRFNGKN